MAASSAPIEPLDDSFAREHSPATIDASDDGHRVLRLPGGEPRPAPATAVSVRRTVGLPDRRSSVSTSGRGWLIRAGVFGIAGSVLLAGSLVIYQLLFRPESPIHLWFTAPFSASLSSGADLPTGSDLLVPPLGQETVATAAPSAATDDFPNADTGTDSSGPGSGDDTSGSGSDDPAGTDDSSGPGSGGSSGSGSGDSPGSGSGDSSGSGSGDSSGSGSGSGDDSSGHGSGGDSGGDSSGHGSGSDAPSARD